MKIKTILIAAMLAVSGLTQAQVSKDAFEKAVDFVNCKTVELSIQPDANNYQQYIQSCPCGNGVTYAQVKDFLTGIGRYDKTILVAGEIESLKKTFKDGMKSEDALKFLSETIFTDKVKYQKLFLFAEKRKADKDFAVYKEGLKKDLPAILSAPPKTSTTNPNSDVTVNKLPTIDERVTALEQRPETNVEEKGWFEDHLTIFVIISFIISIILIALKIFQVVRNSSDIDALNADYASKNYVKEKIGQAGFNLNSNSGTTTFEVRNLKEEIEKLRGEVKQLSYKIESSKIPFEIVQPQYEQQSWQDTKQPEVKSETFFLSNPNVDGSFNESSASPTYKEGASIYKFTKIGNGRAKFQIDERETSIKFALTYPDKNIIPVCDSVNEYESKYTQIKTLNQGEAELQNGKWIVNKNQKAKISYES